MPKRDDKGDPLLDTIEMEALKQESRVFSCVAVAVIVLIAILLFSRLLID